MNEELLKAISQLMDSRFSGLTKPIRKNLLVLTVAFILVLSAVRSGQGRLSLAALARVLPTQGTAHAREKRLHRFLKNPRLDFRTVTGSLAAIVLPPGKRFCSVIVDQTKSGSAQALLAAVPYAEQTLPLACYSFAYPLTEPAIQSQNQLEHIFLLDTESSLAPKVIAVWIADCAYARSLLLQQSEQEQRPYIVQKRKETIITSQGRPMKSVCPLPMGRSIIVCTSYIEVLSELGYVFLVIFDTLCIA